MSSSRAQAPAARTWEVTDNAGARELAAPAGLIHTLFGPELRARMRRRRHPDSPTRRRVDAARE